jgi:acetyl/propionyl-CoA carboxylase alpha subunit
MKVALDEIEIVGVPTTIPLHRVLVRDDRFIRGEFDTTYLNEIVPHVNSEIMRLEKAAAIVAAAGKFRNPTRMISHHRGEPSNWRTAARAHLMKKEGHGW